MSDTYNIERCVLGCLTQYPNKYAHTLTRLSDEFFKKSEHKAIYSTLLKAYKTHDVNFDSSIVIALLEGIADEYDVKQELVECCTMVFESTPFDEHMKILYSTAKERFIKSQLQRILLDGDCSTQALKDVISVCERAYELSDTRDLKNGYERYIENLGKIQPAVRTGFSKVDRVTGGLQEGTLCIVGARPSVGKTTYALNISSNVVRQGKKVIFFSLEMTSKMVLDRLSSRLCRIDYDKFKKPLSKSEIDLVNSRLSGEIKDHLIVIDDVNTVENICNYIVRYSPELVVIDYAQIVKTVKECDNIRVQIDYISSLLKQTAKRTKCCVLLLSQLSRKAVASDKPPSMSDLKESSGLEQDGDYIFLLHRPYTENKLDYTPTETKLIVEKNKFGSTGVIDLYFDGSHQEFREIEMKLKEG